MPTSEERIGSSGCGTESRGDSEFAKVPPNMFGDVAPLREFKLDQTVKNVRGSESNREQDSRNM